MKLSSSDALQHWTGYNFVILARKGAIRFYLGGSQFLEIPLSLSRVAAKYHLKLIECFANPNRLRNYDVFVEYNTRTPAITVIVNTIFAV